ncbi:hypothetical protein VNO77_28022 [Canavalia gladiata]|uniref:F-box domain-containing protein n=1 Tax=Canavalia gladiata TaxID=3824 RepID=A0AAN9KVQ5_CANGL
MARGRRASKRQKMKQVMKDDENRDFISNLPNDVLIIILSKLRIDEAVRCGVLSKRWLNIWKRISYLEFDARHMVKPLTQLLQSREPRTVPDLNILAPSIFNVVYASNARIIILILSHLGIISTCRIRHFKKNLGLGDVETWVLCLNSKKGVKDLSLECAPDCGETEEKLVSWEETYIPYFPIGIFNTLGSLELTNYTMRWWQPFQGCSQLKKLKLKRICLDAETLNGILKNCEGLENFSLLESTGFNRLVIQKSKLKVLQLQALCVEETEICCMALEVLLLDSIICDAVKMAIFAPFLREFNCYCCSIYGRMLSVKRGKSILQAHLIFSNCFGFFGRPPICKFFQNLSTLSIDLDLTSMLKAMILSIVFKSTPNLQAIEIALPVFKPKNSVRVPTLHLISMFWERQQEWCYCIHHKLKFVYLRGFRAKVQEMDFVKYLIARATVLERITIICSDSMEAAENLLSLPRTSTNLSIDLRLNTKNSMDEFAEHQDRKLK